MKNTQLFFGSSRIQQLSDSIVGDSILNLNYIYKDPSSIYNFLKKLDKTHWKNIEKVYVFLDFHLVKNI